MTKWVRNLYQPGLPLGADGTRVTGSKEHIELSRAGAREGMVLLKNNGALPISKGTKVALFGKGTVDYVKGGGGSGDVTVKYIRSLYDGLKIKESEGKIEICHDVVKFYEEDIAKQYADGYAPGMTEEPVLPEELLNKAAEFADVAIVTICRFSGEGWDRKASLEPNEALWAGELQMAERQAYLFPDGDYCLTENEAAMIDAVKFKFDKVIVVLNVGGVIETGWIKDDDLISSALLMWQGGIEGGLAAADLLVGDDCPSGKLVDSFADTLEDYPSSYNFHDSNAYAEYTDDIYVGYRYFQTLPDADKKIVYPFGYGLSYTTFSLEVTQFATGDALEVKVKVTNTGDVAGKEVVMLYMSAPQGLLGKPSKSLLTFSKTQSLAPGASEELTLSVPVSALASFDDTGKIAKSAWVIEEGIYEFFIGSDVTALKKIDKAYEVASPVITEQLTQKLAPSNLKERLRPDGSMEVVPMAPERATHSIFPHMPTRESEGLAPVTRAREQYHIWGDDRLLLKDVAEGKVTLDEFIEQLSIDDLIHLTGGQKNLGVSNTLGVGDMPEYGVPDITTADGPAGLRILPEVGVCTTAWPCATMLACSCNVELATKIGEAAAKEVKENNIGIWLAPAVNIHRTPMCGRNFEYYSEDPVIAGKIGAAVVKGVQSQHIAATVKHFAFNNKETNRKNSDSRVSERAAREIYLKPFEIIVKEAHPWCIMTAYNKVNGIQCSENEELLNGILRGEWGFDGLVMTDWWTSGEHYLETKAGNDLKMASGLPARVREAYDKGEISRDEIYAAAKNVLKLILKFD